MASQSRDAAVVGIHEYPSRDVDGEVNALQIKAASAAKALADAGLSWQDVDAIYDASEGAPMSDLMISEYFGISPGPIAINISGQEFGLGDPVATLTKAVNKANISASALELEITETVLMSDIRSVMLALHALREEGFSLAVDDFGTGYSSLRYLQKFPIDVLKIDSSFVHDVERNTDSRAICTAIIALARSLELKVVGEGVENNWQLEFLKRQACNTVQGFLLSKPLSPNDFADHQKRRLPRNKSIDRVVQLSSRM